MRVLAYSPNDWQVDSPLRNGVCLSKSGRTDLFPAQGIETS
jgi:hypothetical protein